MGVAGRRAVEYVHVSVGRYRVGVAGSIQGGCGSKGLGGCGRRCCRVGVCMWWGRQVAEGVWQEGEGAKKWVWQARGVFTSGSPLHCQVCEWPRQEARRDAPRTHTLHGPRTHHLLVGAGSKAA